MKNLPLSKPMMRGRIFRTLIMAGLLSMPGGPVTANNPWDGGLNMQELNELYFGTIAPDLHTPGIVEVRPNRDSFSRCGHPLICLEGGTRGRFRITSTRTQFIHISLPDEATLTNNMGDQMRVSDFNLHGQNFTRGRGRIQKNRPRLISVGAKLSVGAQQPPGRYQGTYEITVTYE